MLPQGDRRGLGSGEPEVRDELRAPSRFNGSEDTAFEYSVARELMAGPRPVSVKPAQLFLFGYSTA